jgi:hypothetical protein
MGNTYHDSSTFEKIVTEGIENVNHNRDPIQEIRPGPALVRLFVDDDSPSTCSSLVYGIRLRPSVTKYELKKISAPSTTL